MIIEKIDGGIRAFLEEDLYPELIQLSPKTCKRLIGEIPNGNVLPRDEQLERGIVSKYKGIDVERRDDLPDDVIVIWEKKQKRENIFVNEPK